MFHLIIHSVIVYLSYIYSIFIICLSYVEDKEELKIFFLKINFKINCL